MVLVILAIKLRYRYVLYACKSIVHNLRLASTLSPIRDPYYIFDSICPYDDEDSKVCAGIFLGYTSCVPRARYVYRYITFAHDKNDVLVHIYV